MNIDDIPITLNDFAKKYTWPTISGLRAYRNHQSKFGLTKAFLKVGKRVLVRPKTFFELIVAIKDHDFPKG